MNGGMLEIIVLREVAKSGMETGISTARMGREIHVGRDGTAMTQTATSVWTITLPMSGQRVVRAGTPGRSILVSTGRSTRVPIRLTGRGWSPWTPGRRTPA